MVEVELADRKSTVLLPSSIACLSRMPTVNLTSGCAHQCLYCYTRGYKTHPGVGKVTLYRNTFEKIRAELPRKRKRPRAVYFSPSSDLFQPIPEALEMAYEILDYLFAEGIGVAFLTKGEIPERHMALLEKNAPLVRAQIGLISLDDRVLSGFEPCAASAQTRLAQIERIASANIVSQVRLDPILPGLTDDEESLEALCAALANRGVKRIAASVLFLRSAVVHSFNKNIADKELLDSLLGQFSQRHSLGIHAGKSRVNALSPEVRRAIHARVSEIAGRHGIATRLCSCKNPDVTNQCCTIAGDWSRPADDTHRQLDFL